MSFREAVKRDIGSVFLNLGDFGERRKVVYDGESYYIPVVLTQIRESERIVVSESDHGQGLYKASARMHCAKVDLNGIVPEQGMRVKVGADEGEDAFMMQYRVSSVSDDMGMLNIELEAFDE